MSPVRPEFSCGTSQFKEPCGLEWILLHKATEGAIWGLFSFPASHPLEGNN